MPQSPIIRGGPVRARELRENIRTMGFEPGTIHTLERLLDEWASTRNQLRDMVQIIDQQGNMIAQFLQIGEGMKEQIERLKRTRDMTDEVNHGE